MNMALYASVTYSYEMMSSSEVYQENRNPLNKITSAKITTEPKQRRPINRGARLGPNPTCANCKTNKTSLWRRDR